jgi:hypothetical protein
MKASIVEKFGRLVVREIEEPKPGDYDAIFEFLYGKGSRTPNDKT